MRKGSRDMTKINPHNKIDYAFKLLRTTRTTDSRQTEIFESSGKTDVPANIDIDFFSSITELFSISEKISVYVRK